MLAAVFVPEIALPTIVGVVSVAEFTLIVPPMKFDMGPLPACASIQMSCWPSLPVAKVAPTVFVPGTIAKLRMSIASAAARTSCARFAKTCPVGYAAFAAFDMAEAPPPYTMFPGVCPSWLTFPPISGPLRTGIFHF